MSKRNDLDFLNDILEASQRIISYCDNLAYDQFMDDKKTQDAVVRNFEILGEAVKNLSDKVTKQYPDVTWSDFAKVRDKLIHHYFGVDDKVLWDTLGEDFDEFQKVMTEISNKLD